MLICFLSAVSMTSCQKDFLDINKDPNNAFNADAKFLFAAAAADLSHNRSSELNIPLAFMSQNWSSGGNFGWGVDEARYDISIFTTGNTWRSAYTSQLKNLSLAISDARAKKDFNTVAQCNIVRASVYAQTTLLWEKIPFTQSINATFDQPNFDDQPTVLNGVLAILDSAIQQINVNSPIRITNEDYYFKGDMSKWIKYANSLKLRTLMTMVDADPTKATDIAALIARGNMISSTDNNVLFKYYAAAGSQSPKFRILDQYAGGKNIFFFANDIMFNLMQPKNDPRLPIFFEPFPDQPASTPLKAIGVADEADKSYSVIGSAVLSATTPDILFTYSEQLLLEAEAHARGFAPGGLAAANSKFKLAVAENMKFYGIAAPTIATYVATLPDLTTLSPQAARAEISKQQWIDYFSRPIEAFTQWRRSGPEGAEVPALPLPNGAPAGGIIRRLQYPPLEVASNPKTPPQVPLTNKMWFDK